MRISDWSSDVCSSDLGERNPTLGRVRRFHQATRSRPEQVSDRCSSFNTCCLVANNSAPPDNQSLEALSQHQGRTTQLDDFDLAPGNEDVQGAAADADKAAGIGEAHGERPDGGDRKSV